MELNRTFPGLLWGVKPNLISGPWILVELHVQWDIQMARSNFSQMARINFSQMVRSYFSQMARSNFSQMARSNFNKSIWVDELKAHHTHFAVHWVCIQIVLLTFLKVHNIKARRFIKLKMNHMFCSKSNWTEGEACF